MSQIQAKCDRGERKVPRTRPSSLSERKLDTLFMAGFFPITGNHALNSAALVQLNGDIFLFYNKSGTGSV